MKPESVQDLYVLELRDLYSAGRQVVKALPNMSEAAGSQQPCIALGEHVTRTGEQVERLQRIFGMLDESPEGSKCKGMEGLIGEGEEMMAEAEDSPPAVRDAGLISVARRVGHYEVAGYGTVRTYASRPRMEDHARLLAETLAEVKQSDRKLTEVAESFLDEEAKSA